MITEGHDADLADLDLRATADVVRALNDANAVVARRAARAPKARSPPLVDAAGARAGRVVYVGAGSAGQMAAADAAEWGPTFSVAGRARWSRSWPGRVAARPGRARGAPRTTRTPAPPSWSRRRADARRRGGRRLGLRAARPTRWARCVPARDAGALTAAVVCAPGSPLAAAGRPRGACSPSGPRSSPARRA